MSLITNNTSGQRLQGLQQLVHTPGVIATTSVPAFQFSVLTCSWRRIATKTIYPDGKEQPFGNAKYFLFHHSEIHSLEEFAEALEWLSNEPRRFIIQDVKAGLYRVAEAAAFSEGW